MPRYSRKQKKMIDLSERLNVEVYEASLAECQRNIQELNELEKQIKLRTENLEMQEDTYLDMLYKFTIKDGDIINSIFKEYEIMAENRNYNNVIDKLEQYKLRINNSNQREQA